MPTSKRVLLLSLVLSIAFGIARFDEFPVGAMLDDAIYAEMARSLAEGRGPVIYLHPRIDPQQSWAFPIGYPLLLSPVAFILPGSVQALKAFSAIVTLAMLLVFWVSLPKGSDTVGRSVLLALVALNPWIITYSNRVLSEAAYLFLSLSAIAVFMKWTEKPTPSIPLAIWLSVLTGLAVSVRSIGLALIAAFAVYLVATHRWRFLVVFAASAGLALVPQGVLNHRTGSLLFTPGYQAQLVSHSQSVGDRLWFMWGNFTGYIKELPAALVPVFGTNVAFASEKIHLGGVYSSAQLVCGSVILLLILAGLLGREARKARFAAVSLLYCLFYGVALLNFSGNGQPVQLRLLVPLLPVLYYLMLNGMQAVSEIVRSVRYTPARAAMLVFVLVSPLSILHNTYRSVYLARDSPEQSGRGFVDYSAGSSWVLDHTAPEEVVMTYCPLERHLFLRRPVVDFGTTPPTTLSELDSRVGLFGVSYLLIGPSSPDTPRRLDSNGGAILSLLQQAPNDGYQLVHQEPEHQVFVYRVHQGDTAPRPDNNGF